MTINHRIPICGVRPAILKRLFTRDVVTVERIATATDKTPAEAEALAAELMAAGYLAARDDDGWRVEPLGWRLAASPLINRFPVEVGRRLVEEMIAEAARIEADPTHSEIVEQIVLFGSLLNGSEDGLIGDVDVAVTTAQRWLGDSDRQQIAHQAEIDATCPVSYLNDWNKQRRWPRDRTLRRLKRRDRRISLHFPQDAERTTHRLIYMRPDEDYPAFIDLPWS